MSIATCFSKEKMSGSPNEASRKTRGAEFDAVVQAMVAGDTLAFARLLGYQELPPSPGTAASWDAKDWMLWGNSNGLTANQKAKHGYKIFNPDFPGIAVYPAGRPGDMRGGMNCAADYRRSFTAGIASLWYRFSLLGKWIYHSGLLVDKTIPTIPELIRIARDTEREDIEAALDLGMPSVGDTQEYDSAHISVNQVYGAVSYLARYGDKSLTYADVVLNAIREAGVTHADRTAAVRAVTILTDLKRAGEATCACPVQMFLVYQIILQSAEDAKRRKEEEREAKRAERAAYKAARMSAKSSESTAKTPIERFRGELEAVRETVVEQLGRFRHDIQQLSERHDKVLEVARALKLPEPTELIQEVQDLRRKLDEALTENEALEAALEDAKDAQEARANAIQQQLESFASTVHHKLSTKDFMEIAMAIREILPVAEKLALGDIAELKQDNKTQ